MIDLSRDAMIITIRIVCKCTSFNFTYLYNLNLSMDQPSLAEYISTNLLLNPVFSQWN